MEKAHRILIVDDEEFIRKGLARTVLNMGHEVEVAADAAEARQKAISWAPDLIITDRQLPDGEGLELIAELQDRGVEATFLMLTGHGTIDNAVEATRRGVYDYLIKPVEIDRLRDALAKGLERADMRKEVLHLRRELMQSGRLQDLVGVSPAMQELYRLIEQVAPTNASTLIVGESGTGKEIVARTLHNLSPRSLERFVAINCAAIPESLLESELFGHEKGSFTGATSARSGCFEMAHRGTIFLDEIGDMPISLQSKLLRVLEDGRVRRLGSSVEQSVDVRVVAATNADVTALRGSGRFREDLYFRLNVFTIQLPALRARKQDIPMLLEHFREQYARENRRPVVGFTPEAMEILREYAWPGNVRELRNIVQRAVILCREEEIGVRDLPPALRAASGRAVATSGGVGGHAAPAAHEAGAIRLTVGTSIEEAERRLVLETLSVCGGNKTRASALLGITPKTLYAKLRQYAATQEEPEPGGEATAPLG